VDADGPVELILSGVGLTGPKCLQLLSGDPVVLTAAEGSVNTLSDGGETPDDYAGAVLYAKSPLTIGGQGALNILAGLNNAIQCREGITVGGGTVTLRAAGAGIKVRGDLILAGGSLTIESGGDGIAADDELIALRGRCRRRKCRHRDKRCDSQFFHGSVSLEWVDYIFIPLQPAITHLGKIARR
jgi:hypothetical protein